MVLAEGTNSRSSFGDPFARSDQPLDRLLPWNRRCIADGAAA
jgi:hypothetical protein